MRRMARGAGTVARALVIPLALVALLFALKGCGMPQSAGINANFGNGVVDWVDFVQFDGIMYLAADDRGSRSLEDNDLGPVYATVQYMLSGNVNDPGYRAQDGDTAFLTTGTTIYAVKGYAPSFRLAARRDGRIVLYEADTNPHAKTGADLLDIGGKVRSISILSDQDGVTPLGVIGDAAEVKSLTAMVLAAPVDQSRQSAGGQRYFIAFNLLDGTRVARAYWPGTGELSRGILLPAAFADAVASALRT